MDRREAIITLRANVIYACESAGFDGATINLVTEALDLAIEALRGDFHCPKCGTIVRDGRQYHDLVYRGEAEVTDTDPNDTISRQAIEYHTQLESRGNGQYEEVEVAYKSDIDSLPPVDPVTSGYIQHTTEIPKYTTEWASSSDLISRQAAIEAVEKQYFGGTVADINPSWRKLHNILESLPPVEPERPKGEWIELRKPCYDGTSYYWKNREDGEA